MSQIPRLAGNTFHHIAQRYTFAQVLTTNAFRTTQPQFKGPLPRAPIMNRARRGLFHGKHIMFGNHVAHSERKSRRTWLPNIQTHRYTSELLGKEFKFKLSTKAMRCIDKCGGFDNYILNTHVAYLGGQQSVGGKLKEQMVAAHQLRQKQNALAAWEQEFNAKMQAAEAKLLAKFNAAKATEATSAAAV